VGSDGTPARATRARGPSFRALQGSFWEHPCIRRGPLRALRGWPPALVSEPILSTPGATIFWAPPCGTLLFVSIGACCLQRCAPSPIEMALPLQAQPWPLSRWDSSSHDPRVPTFKSLTLAPDRLLNAQVRDCASACPPHRLAARRRTGRRLWTRPLRPHTCSVTCLARHAPPYQSQSHLQRLS
jgi:hypothetical protein